LDTTKSYIGGGNENISIFIAKIDIPDIITFIITLLAKSSQRFEAGTKNIEEQIRRAFAWGLQ